MVQQNFIGNRRDTGEKVEFPVVWSDAAAAQLTWRWDAEHSPFPLTPLSQEFSKGGGAFASAAQSLGAEPMPQMGSVAAHGYRYNAGRGGPFGSQTPAYIETVSELAPRIGELWDRGWRLEIEARGREIEKFDYDSLSLIELVERIESMAEGVDENMDLMFRAAHLVSFSRAKLVEFCASHIGEAAESLVTDLLQGTKTESLESGAALWDVAQVLAGNPEALDHLRGQPDSAGLSGLAEIEAAGDFLASFNQWLEQYGHRNGSFGELAEPTWFEEPGVAIGLVLQYVDAKNPRLGQQRAITVRVELQAEFEKRLRDPKIIGEFRQLLATAEPYLGVRESRDHATVMAFTAIRVPVLALGRRLVEPGAIASADDVFFLRFEDLKTAAQDPASDFRALVDERRTDYEHWRNVAPPATIGADPAREPEPKIIRGVAASPGAVTGTARVIMSLTEATKLGFGEILVTRGTTPAWTPLFGTAAAVVTEGGGTLSHCAIIAREYGIPAVVSATGATVRIRDGAKITVDGTKARVILED